MGFSKMLPGSVGKGLRLWGSMLGVCVEGNLCCEASDENVACEVTENDESKFCQCTTIQL
jgi:hypothetical protein